MKAAELEQLSSDLRLVASKTLKAGSLTYGVFSGDRSRLEHSIITIVYRRSDGRPIAFNALALMEISLAGKPYEVLHLGLVMVDPDERSRGLSWILYGLTCFLMFLRNQLRPIWISNVTQVPAVVGMVAEAFSQCVSRTACRRAAIADPCASGAADHGAPPPCLRRRSRRRFRRRALRHHQCLYRRLGRSEEDVRRGGQASRRDL